MLLIALLAAPLFAAGLVALTRDRLAGIVHGMATVTTAALALAVTVTVVRRTSVDALGGFLRADALSAWMVALIGVVAALAALEAPPYARGAAHRFYPFFHLFVFTMLLAVTTDDVGFMWVAVEGTTLASVFLVNFERTRASLEASYKYVLICSVGIAVAFLGTVLIYFADVARMGGLEHALRWTTLRQLAPGLSPRIVEMAFVFLLVGYGTKAGLAPMHTWLPDAHSEAPAPVSAMMSGILLAIGVYAILRFKPIVDVAAGPAVATRLLIGLGLASVAVAAAFLWNPKNYKRMLAYSSVEHLGLVSLGLGFGGPWGIAGAMLHVGNHALAKSVLFLLSGRIRSAYSSIEIDAVRGLLARLPITGPLFFAAMLALMGLPPFGLFVSEVLIFGAGVAAGHTAVVVVAVGLVVIAFAGLLRSLQRMLYGEAAGRGVERGAWTAVPLVAALGLLLMTGLAWPPGLADALASIADVIAP
ncbi:MAG TPA: proton-conducting transporter membrane subunit [Methylomirabilota bacterium]|nr:proton-conducting transporter membrane subunit [Methylomirabilota bacterium]